MTDHQSKVPLCHQLPLTGTVYTGFMLMLTLHTILSGPVDISVYLDGKHTHSISRSCAYSHTKPSRSWHVHQYVRDQSASTHSCTEQPQLWELTLPPQPPQRILAADTAARASGPAAAATACSFALLVGLADAAILASIWSRPVLYMLMNLRSM